MSDPVSVVRSSLAGDEVIAVTGATGWLGSAAVRVLGAAFGSAAPDRLHLLAGRPRSVAAPWGGMVEARALDDLAHLVPVPTHVMHFAYLTRDRAATVGLEAYVAANLRLTTAVLEAVDVIQPRGLVYASSGAVHGRDGRLASDLDGNPYGTLKHLDELAFTAACSTVQAACVVPRIYSVGGPGLVDPRRYALGDLVMSALAGGPLEVTRPGRSSGPSWPWRRWWRSASRWLSAASR